MLNKSWASCLIDDVGSHFAALDDRNGAAGDEITVVVLGLVRIGNSFPNRGLVEGIFIAMLEDGAAHNALNVQAGVMELVSKIGVLSERRGQVRMWNGHNAADELVGEFLGLSAAGTLPVVVESGRVALLGIALLG